jgi:hypothetical protein
MNTLDSSAHQQIVPASSNHPANNNQTTESLNYNVFDPGVSETSETPVDLTRVSQVVLNTSELITAKVYNAISREYLCKKEDGTHVRLIRNSLMLQMDPLLPHIQMDSTVLLKPTEWPKKMVEDWAKIDVHCSKTWNKICKIIYPDGTFIELDENGNPTDKQAPISSFDPNISG